ncbi:MAG: helix-turn-helix transcriptional regulator [Firmicutes bacterium]|nr:helix-turn-helix transcriptional regulator [Bacillota bacterium]
MFAIKPYCSTVIRFIQFSKRHKTRYWLYKQLGMSCQNFNKMVNNETKSIKYETLDTICALFDCTPNDLLIYDEDK